jgi:hypothetical protein
VTRVDVLVAERWIEKVIEMKRVCERIMVLRVAVGGKYAVCDISVCSAGRSFDGGKGRVLLKVEQNCDGNMIR